ncbi:type I restriction endonuclease subunit R [Arcobacter sp. F2176]|uniref:type I restriction endonuclease subunit R n=1 Tax=Arcobacter sp. F2176 TaxID=2044511 RepID=UPI00100B4C31|nr:type I restriction endonuclease [Arcobacter sp. F2176]RXJ82142.1 restriction endonuclease subunit R [Arcobacter sp. F2176]
MKYNEDTRVKIPSILHLTRLGYKYLSLKNSEWDINTNIFTDIFKSSIERINKTINDLDLNKVYEEVFLLLDYEDFGQAFYLRIIEKSGIKLIDFENFENNSFHIVTELPCKNGDEEFRPDITLLINGMPLVFIEVKKPNNKDGVLAERERINVRFSNDRFRKFINITQIMVFSNNMEYDDNSIEPIEGAFYATPSKNPIFNYFREEEKLNLAQLLNDLDNNTENEILKDNNLEVIKNNAEFITNKSPNTPTNRLSTSLFSKDRLKFLLEFGIAYVKSKDGLQKHIMRYPQIFATRAIESKLDEGIKKGIIWHTQGSGKTALAFYNVRYLTSYFQTKKIIPKFYFIVDRLDLLTQAKKEFTARGLKVHTIASREDFAKDIKKTTAIHNDRGEYEITVVNIQKFEDDPNVISIVDYDINIQRVYFLDEVHRSYNPKGNFLANLETSDKNAIKIGLTGTPLLGEDTSSKLLFGDYIHKYYYNSSIADGYTLRLIREEIETTYKLQLQKAIEDIEILQGNLKKEEVYSHKKFVEPMLAYIVNDFKNSKVRFDDDSIGAMVICDSSAQAKKMYEIFQLKYAKLEAINNENLLEKLVSEPQTTYGINDTGVKRGDLTGKIILHDTGTIQERKDWVEEFKDGKIDILFVDRMLLTGFDAPRLKKLYLGRIIRKHGLLQALTRVNRTYKKFKYGFVVDFADISKEFDATNKAYFEELQNELGNEIESYSSLFKSKEEIEEEIENIKDILFEYDTLDAEIFSQQISKIQDIKKMQEIKKVLENAKSLYNLIRLFGHSELLEKIDFRKLNLLYREASNHLDLLNQKLALEKGDENTNIINLALEDIIFKFTKISEEELILADKLKNTLRKTREAFQNNFDKKDPEYITLKEELERLFKNKNFSEITQDEMNENIGELKKIDEKIRELNRQNDLLKDKYKGDRKYARMHKRIKQNNITDKQSRIFNALEKIKIQLDEKVLNNSAILKHENFFIAETQPIVDVEFEDNNKIELNDESFRYINTMIATEYLNEYNGVNNW